MKIIYESTVYRLCAQDKKEPEFILYKLTTDDFGLRFWEKSVVFDCRDTLCSDGFYLIDSLISDLNKAKK